MPTGDLQEKFWSQDKSARRSPEHPIVNYIFKDKAKKVKNILPNDIGSILDCGCGNGFFQKALSDIFQIECVGIDYSKEMIDNNPNPQKTVASVTAIPFPDNSFDLVTCSALLHHMNKQERIEAVKEMSRVAKKYIFLCEPNGKNPAVAVFSLLNREELGGLDFSLGYLKGLGRAAGLQPTKAFIDAMVPPNKTPLWAFPVIRYLDQTKLNSLLGLDANVLFEKIYLNDPHNERQ
jgi:SAM-dependent methyltransferase